MKITALETLRTEEFANVLWVRVHTDAGVDRTWRDVLRRRRRRGAHPRHAGRAACLAATRCTSRRSTGRCSTCRWRSRRTGAEYRAASAIDIALWDLFGKVCDQPVHQMLGGLCRRQAAHLQHLRGLPLCRSHNIKPVSNWNLGESAGPVRGPRRLHDAGRRAWPKACSRAASRR